MKDTLKILKAFRFQVLLTLIALVLEFVLGMYTALFVQFPDTLINGEAWGWSMKSSPIIMLHVLLGTILVLLALSVLSFGIASHNRHAVIYSVAGFIMVGIAYLSGSTFLANVAEDNYSFYMALSFLGCMLAYFAAFYFTRPVEKV